MAINDVVLCAAVIGAVVVACNLPKIEKAFAEHFDSDSKKNDADNLTENFSYNPKMMSVPENVWGLNAQKPQFLPVYSDRPYNTMFKSHPEAKARLSPTFSNVGVGRSIRGTEAPSYMQGGGNEPVPDDHHALVERMNEIDRTMPLYSKAAKDLTNLPANQYQEFASQQQQRQELLDTSDLLPALSMDTSIGDSTYGRNIADPNTWMVDNHITVLQKHRNDVGNPFAGDLMIKPVRYGNWDSSLGRSAVSVLRQGYFSSGMGAPIDTEEDGENTLVTSQRNVEAQRGIIYERFQ
jgi:hypothetical protein